MTGADTKVFISHSHKDVALAERVIDLIKGCLVVPSGAIICSTVPGYKLEPGELISETLQQELQGALRIVALLTPNSIRSPWVLFELGAVWGLDQSPLPLLVRSVETSALPGPLRDVVAGQMEEPSDLYRVIETLREATGWEERKRDGAISSINAVAEFAKSLDFDRPVTFAGKLAQIGLRQQGLLSLVTERCRKQGYATPQELHRQFEGAELYYRLEQLHLLGFVTKQRTDDGGHRYGLTEDYRAEIGLG